MNIHEYQAKELLAKFGVAIPKGEIARTSADAEAVAKRLGGPVYVVKAQIHAGGRGAGYFKGKEKEKGGVRVVMSPAEVRENAHHMLGQVLVTNQTGPDGKKVKQLYIENGCSIRREIYLSCLVDRKLGCIVFVVSSEGGTNIEEVAAVSPEKITTTSIDLVTGVEARHGMHIGSSLGLDEKQHAEMTTLLKAVYNAFLELDASMIEINPLVVTSDNELMALDAKMNFDENALFRHPDIEALRDEDEEDPAEFEAAKHDLNYVKLGGSIGCMVNGAGLAMATMDIIKLYGALPANFLDVGGGATKDRVAAAFRIILSDSNVKGILVNIFGGIMRCDVIAEGVVAAAREIKVEMPLVVRLEGTNVESGKKIMRDSGLPIISADSLGDAAEKIVSAVKKVR